MCDEQTKKFWMSRIRHHNEHIKIGEYSVTYGKLRVVGDRNPKVYLGNRSIGSTECFTASQLIAYAMLVEEGFIERLE